MGAFFLHRSTYSNVEQLYPNIFASSNAGAYQGDYKKSGLLNFGWRGMIYEVAQAGGLGTVSQVEQTGLYDFMSYLSYLRAQSKLEELTAKRAKP